MDGESEDSVSVRILTERSKCKEFHVAQTRSAKSSPRSPVHCSPNDSHSKIVISKLHGVRVNTASHNSDSSDKDVKETQDMHKMKTRKVRRIRVRSKHEMIKLELKLPNNLKGIERFFDSRQKRRCSVKNDSNLATQTSTFVQQ